MSHNENDGGIVIVIRLLIGLSIFSLSVLKVQWSWSDFDYVGSTEGIVADYAVYSDPATVKTYLYVAQGAALIVYDVSDWRRPQEIQRLFPAPAFITKLAINEKILAASISAFGVILFSLDDPANPQTIYQFEKYYGTTIDLLNTALLIVDADSKGGGPSSHGVRHQAYDISDPRNPIDFWGVTFCYNMAYSPSFHYLSYQPKGSTEIFEITQGIPPGRLYRRRIVSSKGREVRINARTQIGSDEWNDRYARKIQHAIGVGSTAFFFFQGQVKSFDLSDPQNPLELSTLPLGEYVNPIVMEGTTAIVSQPGGCFFLDLSNPHSLRIDKTISLPFTPQKIANGYAYAYTPGAVLRTPLENGASQEEARIPVETYTPQWAKRCGDLLFSGWAELNFQSEKLSLPTTIRIHSITENDKLIYQSELKAPGAFRELYREDSTLIVQTDSGYYRYSIADPANPAFYADFYDPERIDYSTYSPLRRSTLLHKGYFYVYEYRDERHLFKIYKIDDQRVFHELKTIPAPHSVNFKAAAGNFTYYLFADSNWPSTDSHLGMIDLSDPEKPQWRGFFLDDLLHPGNSWSLFISQNNLYALNQSGLHRCDLSDPLHPIDRGYTPFPRDKNYWPTILSNAFIASANSIASLDVYDEETLDPPIFQKLRIFYERDLHTLQPTQQITFGPIVNPSIVELNHHLLLPANSAGFYWISKP